MVVFDLILFYFPLFLFTFLFSGTCPTMDVNVLLFLETFLGNISSWPIDILRDLFVYTPISDTVRRVSAFMYGNGIPFSVASYFFSLCHGLEGACTTVRMFSFYRRWSYVKDALHQEQYYNTKFKKLYWLNGSNCSQHEPVIPEVTAIPTGYKDTEFH